MPPADRSSDDDGRRGRARAPVDRGSVTPRERSARRCSQSTQGDAERRVVELESEVTALSGILVQLRERARDLGVTREAQETERKRVRADLDAATAELDRVGSELTKVRSRLQSLEEIAGRYENYGQGVRELMRKSEVRSRTKAVVAEVIDVPAGLEQAIAAVLGERLQDLVVDDLRAASDVAAVITSTKLGRAAAMPIAPRCEAVSHAAPVGPGVVGMLSDMIGFDRGTSRWCDSSWRSGGRRRPVRRARALGRLPRAHGRDAFRRGHQPGGARLRRPGGAEPRAPAD